MNLTIDAKRNQVETMLRERGVYPVFVDYDDIRCVTEICVVGRDVKSVIIDIARNGWRWWRGSPRMAHADPTYAQAAQRVMRRSAGR